MRGVVLLMAQMRGKGNLGGWRSCEMEWRWSREWPEKVAEGVVNLTSCKIRCGTFIEEQKRSAEGSYGQLKQGEQPKATAFPF